VEAIEQLNRALAQIATLPASPELRRAQIRFQAALITPLIHVKGFAASETREAAARTRQLIEHADALGEPPEDPLLLFSVLFSFHGANIVAFDGDVSRDIAADFLAFAEKQGASVPLAIGHRLMGHSLMFSGDITNGLAHYNASLALYDPVEHRSLSSGFGQDGRTTALSYRSIALWLLGSPDAAVEDAEAALREAREIAQAGTLMNTLFFTSITHSFCGNYALANAHLNKLVALAGEKGAALWTATGTTAQGHVMALTDRASNAVQAITTGLRGFRSTGTTQYRPFWLSYLARAYAELGQFDDAWRCIDEALTAIRTTKETWFEAEVNRIAGEIALKSPGPDTEKAERYFDRALAGARQQQAKWWELRAAISMARLWRDQGKPQQARELLAPIYGWFTEGFDTLDLKEAKALLNELHA
jgi:predicted ATPase